MSYFKLQRVVCRLCNSDSNHITRRLASWSAQEDGPSKDRQFIDRITVNAIAGRGGNGAASFWKSAAKGKYTPADGGNGGPGGSIIVRANKAVRNLSSVKQLYKAEPGGHGQPQKRLGKEGADKLIEVPMGTCVYMLPAGRASETSNEEDQTALLESFRKPWIGELDYSSSSEADDDEIPKYGLVADLIDDGDHIRIARGGRGGRGNASFAARPNRPAPSTCEKGDPGETVKVLLEMKLIADLAFVGLPNVGKSSLLRAISAATPRVADFEFTTLSPQLGAVSLPSGASCSIADVPGLLAGAHANRGLGHKFLKHIERTRALAYVIDLSRGEDQGSPYQQFTLLQEEIGLYSEKLLSLPHIIIGNKVDVAPPGAAVGLRRRVPVSVISVSATEKTGIRRLLTALEKTLIREN